MLARMTQTPSSGWLDEPVQIVPYDNTWPLRFAEESARIEQLIAEWITGGVHHVGSTSVPGLAAKPIIDIAVGVADLASSRPCIDLLAQLDYCYAPYRAEVMHWFCKPSPSHRTHHLHLLPTGSQRLHDELAFRDYLRAHPTVASEYSLLKRDLAGRYRDDRDAYTDAKHDFVADTTRAAHIWYDAATDPTDGR